MQQPTCSGLGMWGGRGRRRRRVCTKKKAGAFGLPHLPPSHRSLPRPPPSSQARSSGGAGERAGGEEGSLSSFCSVWRPDSTRSSQPRASAAPAFFSICAGEFGTRELPSHSSISALGARLGLRSPRSVRIWRFRSVLGAALTGCDLKGGGLAQDLGRFLPLSLCIHLGCSHV
jgi:hypothetical protein